MNFPQFTFFLTFFRHNLSSINFGWIMPPLRIVVKMGFVGRLPQIQSEKPIHKMLCMALSGPMPELSIK
ncbi:MAG: hypothetical protein RBT11_20560, partial [Desulfobacterales bacterium]|nr:hypothetical protein [Desulfobacterales bacterium]